MVPEDWSVQKLLEIAEINPKKPTEPSNGLVSFISMDAVSEAAKLISTEIKNYKNVEKGFTSFIDKDVLVAKITPCFENGKGAFVDGLTNGVGFGSTEFHVLRAKEKNDPYFIYHLTNAHEFRVRGEMNMQGSAGQKRVTTDYLKKLKIPTPPFIEQKKIAQILSTWDKAITITEQLLVNSQQQKKALMQQLLTGKKRLLNDNGISFHDSWKLYKFGKIFVERIETGQNNLPLLSLTADNGVIYQKDTGRKNTSNEDKSKYRKICVDDIVYNTMRMWQGRSSLSDKEGLVSPAYTVITSSEKVIPEFAAYLFKLPNLVNIFYRYSQGLTSDNWNLKFNNFKKICWPFPRIDEQKKIAAVLSAADKKITVLQQKLDMLKQEKKALMQQLLTGKRRVKIKEAA